MSLLLGRYLDDESMEVGPEDVLLKADRLTRHAVCVGMTGSGKTGLCVALLEELAVAGVPVIVIDPKGDMTNLALAFEGHPGKSFEPWVDPAEAERKGISVPEFAEETAAFWRKGLAASGVDEQRIQAFTQRSTVNILTPGSTAGTPVDTLGSLGAPPPAIRDDLEALGELVTGTVRALLGLVGEDGDRVSDPATITLSTILMEAWGKGQDLTLVSLLPMLIDPPFDKVGVFPLDAFWPRKQRMSLAMKLNGVVASPAFAAWSQGVPLDVDAFLSTEGKTPINIFYLAHLDEAQRMFFAATLLNSLVSWSRRQPGTSSLRALVYFDEVFGYLPPHPKNPPTKRPVLTLMKQARAVGVGVMLVTQNPVDVDYKAMSNAGTWFVGRLQTKQDRERVVDSLAASGGDGADRGTVTDWLENLAPRSFVLREVKESAPRLFRSRHAISFLRGPLTKREVEQLPKANFPIPEPSPGTLAAAPSAAPSAADEGLSTKPPPAPEGYEYRFLRPEVVFSNRLAKFFESRSQPAREDRRIAWEPALYAVLHLRFDEGRDWAVERQEQRLFFPVEGRGLGEFEEPPLEEGDMRWDAPDGLYAPLPVHADEVKELKALERRVIEGVLDGETEKMYRNKQLGLVSGIGETVETFKERCVAAADDKADEAIAKLQDKVKVKLGRFEDQLTRKERDLDKHNADSADRARAEYVNVAEMVMGYFFGGRRKSVSGAMNKRSQTRRAQERAERAQDQITDLEREIYELETETEDAVSDIRRKWDDLVDEIETVDVRLEKADIRLQDFGYVWVPVTRPL